MDVMLVSREKLLEKLIGLVPCVCLLPVAGILLLVSVGVFKLQMHPKPCLMGACLITLENNK